LSTRSPRRQKTCAQTIWFN